MKYKVESLIPPRLYLGLDSKTYIIPQWIEVPDYTSIDEIEWILPKSKIEPQITNSTIVATWKPEMGENKYNTRFDERTNKFTCSCPGFWRAKDKEIGCKHIQKLRSGLSEN